MGAMIYVNIASIQGVISFDAFRAAIDLLQKRHPLLQAHLQEAEALADSVINILSGAAS